MKASFQTLMSASLIRVLMEELAKMELISSVAFALQGTRMKLAPQVRQFPRTKPCIMKLYKGRKSIPGKIPQKYQCTACNMKSSE